MTRLFTFSLHPNTRRPHVGQFAVFGWIQTAPTLAHSRTAAATLPACHDAVQTREPAAARPHESSSIGQWHYRSNVRAREVHSTEHGEIAVQPIVLPKIANPRTHYTQDGNS
ncbi:hypothetical protein VDGE_30373 [Verticillium dahliae]|uniref:Uncharacterized protein n=1 Tax=Verticillium dahliae TaxID=27337 RepID=A0A444S671_VERDA|nr:hypothetical protein VDGE_30373 [Verticillium dahliae]